MSLVPRLALAAAVSLAPPALAASPRPAPAPTVDTVELARTEAAVATHHGEERHRLMLEAGELRRLQGDPDGARRWFEALIVEAGDAPAAQAARLGLALLDAAGSGALDPAHADLLVGVPERRLPDTLNAERYAWLAVRAAGEGRDGASHARKALAHASHPDVHAAITARLAAVGLVELGGPEAVADADALPAARDALARGDRSAARHLLQRARLAAAPTPEDAARVDRLQRALDGAPVAPERLGVLLPLSGRFAAVGRQVREALDFGWEAAGAPGELVVVDSGGTADTALEAFDALVEQHGVVAVLGPLLSDEAAPVAEAAETVGVPLVALSQAVDDAEDQPWVFQGWVTPEQQVTALLDHVMGARGMERFVVLAPDSAYGRTAAEAFVAQVQARGGAIVVHETYALDATDLRPVAQKVARRRTAETPPLVDYDAIFIPDSARRVALVAAGLAFEEVPVGTFEPHDDRSVPLLGLSGWNHHELIAGGGIYTERGLFTDVFVPPPETAYTWHAPDPWRRFVDAFKAHTGRTPTPVEALASDVARVVAAARLARADTRAAFRGALTAAEGRDTATGAGRFDPASGALSHQIRVLSVRKDGFAPVAED